MTFGWFARIISYASAPLIWNDVLPNYRCLIVYLIFWGLLLCLKGSGGSLALYLFAIIIRQYRHKCISILLLIYSKGIIFFLFSASRMRYLCLKVGQSLRSKCLKSSYCLCWDSNLMVQAHASRPHHHRVWTLPCSYEEGWCQRWS